MRETKLQQFPHCVIVNSVVEIEATYFNFKEFFWKLPKQIFSKFHKEIISGADIEDQLIS